MHKFDDFVASAVVQGVYMSIYRDDSRVLRKYVCAL